MIAAVHRIVASPELAPLACASPEAAVFDAALFADPAALLLGGLTGLAFGFLLQKGGLTRFEVIVRQFLLRDFTVLKVMLTAIVVGGIGIYAMLALGWLSGLQVKTAQLLANAAGGAIFGVGMAVLGYCPGTGVAALGDGSRHALPGVVGMVVGAALYAEAHPWLAQHVLPVGDIGKQTAATATGLSPWWFMLLLAAAAVALFRGIERWERGGRRPLAPRVEQQPAAG